MAKRKAGVNDIIYELDNEDIVISSDDEVKKPKINLLDTGDITKPAKNEDITTGGRNEVSNVDNSIEDDIVKECTTKTHNGGKMSCDLENNLEEQAPSPQQVEIDIKKPSDCSKTTILNEDIVIDSPGNSDLGVEGCENRTPLVTVRFRDTKLAKSYKKHLKAFMLNLIKLHDGDNYESENETDIELDIWPEDLIDEPQDLFEDNTENNLFFVDTDPCGREAADVPTYSKLSTLISNIPDKEPSPPPTVTRKGPTCFNCDGNHPLRDCQLPRDNARIAEKRKNMAVRVGRYHVEDEQKYGHLIPGRISGKLRHALGLKRHELPLHIYRMRMLGYPPGWLEEARISHSGITLFDSAGNAILEPEEEEGELSEPGSKDKFDIKKILDFPGFNVPASPRYKEEAHLFGLPPMSEQDSKMAMLQMLAPNAMQAYKRKKLTFFPSTATGGIAQAGQAEMELDSGDEVVEFPSIPPLPDEAPPPPPPPPPPPESPAPVTPPPPTPLSPPSQQPLTNEIPEHETEDAEDDLKVINVIQIGDIPVPTPNLIIIDDDSDKPQSNGRRSPTLTELEQNKRLLLNALECETVLDSDEISIIDVKETQKEAKQEDTEIKHGDTETNHGDTETKRKGDNTNETNDQTTNILVENKEINVEIDILMNTTEKSEHNDDEEPQSEEPTEKEPKGLEVQGEPNKSILPTTPSAQEHTNTSSPPDLTRTPDHKTGQVKTTNYGTPIMNVVSSYSKLPSDDKFSKDICDVINFENLPNSTGKYKQISVLLKKVKSEVDRIQES